MEISSTFETEHQKAHGIRSWASPSSGIDPSADSQCLDVLFYILHLHIHHLIRVTCPHINNLQTQEVSLALKSCRCLPHLHLKTAHQFQSPSWKLDIPFHLPRYLMAECAKALCSRNLDSPIKPLPKAPRPIHRHPLVLDMEPPGRA